PRACGPVVAAGSSVVGGPPGKPLPGGGGAEGVGVSPVALYRHFKGRGELVDEGGGHLLTERNAAIPPDGSWQDQLRAWVLGGLDYLVPCAQVVQLVLAGGTARRVDGAAPLAPIL